MPQARERLSSSKNGRLGLERDGAAATDAEKAGPKRPSPKLEEGLRRRIPSCSA